MSIRKTLADIRLLGINNPILYENPSRGSMCRATKDGDSFEFENIIYDKNCKFIGPYNKPYNFDNLEYKLKRQNDLSNIITKLSKDMIYLENFIKYDTPDNTPLHLTIITDRNEDASWRGYSVTLSYNGRSKPLNLQDLKLVENGKYKTDYISADVSGTYITALLPLLHKITIKNCDLKDDIELTGCEIYLDHLKNSSEKTIKINIKDKNTACNCNNPKRLGTENIKIEEADSQLFSKLSITSDVNYNLYIEDCKDVLLDKFIKSGASDITLRYSKNTKINCPVNASNIRLIAGGSTEIDKLVISSIGQRTYLPIETADIHIKELVLEDGLDYFELTHRPKDSVITIDKITCDTPTIELRPVSAKIIYNNQTCCRKKRIKV